MYSPAHNRETDRTRLHQVIREYPFATLISGEQVSHLPLILDGESTLLGHCARANPHWKLLEGEVKAIFHGPHAYISPAWYTEAEDNVPTWNYVTVHVSGRGRLVEDPLRAFEILRQSVARFEAKYKTGWSLPEINDALESLLKRIVAFEIEILEWQGKFKLSQKEEPQNKARTIKELRALGEGELADYMER